jgi:hypothetical protein
LLICSRLKISDEKFSLAEATAYVHILVLADRGKPTDHLTIIMEGKPCLWPGVRP